MTTSNFPTALDTFTNPSDAGGDTLVSVPHDTQHTKANDAIKALQAKLGIDGSADALSVDKILTTKLAAITVLDAPGVSPTNSPADAATGIGSIIAVLGSDLNASNSKQNTIATNLNNLSAKVNALVTWIQANGWMA